jgi:hypothetical protein
LASLSARGKALDKHLSTVHNQIDEMYKRALADLKTIANRKRSILLGDELELQRQLEELNRFDRFLEYIQSGDATHFLFSWARHQQLRQDLHEFRHFREAIDVHLDVKCSGGISVLVDANEPGLQSSSNSPNKTRFASKPIPKSRGEEAAMTITRLKSPVVSHSSLQSPAVGGMVSSSATSAKSPSHTPVKRNSVHGILQNGNDYFSEALGALDDISQDGGSSIAEYMSELSFAEGEGYISD